MERWLNQLASVPNAPSTFSIPDSYSEYAPKTISLKNILSEIQYIRHQVSKSTSKVVFSHNDLQEGNILLLESDSKNNKLPASSEKTTDPLNNPDPNLVFIDFEFASYNYRGFDFANHFIEYSTNYTDQPPYYYIYPERFPSVDTMRQFTLSYLKELNPGKSDAELLPEAQALVEVNSFL